MELPEDSDDHVRRPNRWCSLTHSLTHSHTHARPPARPHARTHASLTSPQPPQLTWFRRSRPHGLQGAMAHGEKPMHPNDYPNDPLGPKTVMKFPDEHRHKKGCKKGKASLSARGANHVPGEQIMCRVAEVVLQDLEELVHLVQVTWEHSHISQGNLGGCERLRA